MCSDSLGSPCVCGRDCPADVQRSPQDVGGAGSGTGAPSGEAGPRSQSAGFKNVAGCHNDHQAACTIRPTGVSRSRSLGMTEWTNPYSEYQHSLREALKDRLRRTNGCVSRDQFMDCTAPERANKAEKMLLRLFNLQTGGNLEWKPEIVSEETLLQKVGDSTAVLSSDLVNLWSKSRKLSLRTAFPYIAPVSNKSQHVGRHSFRHAPVFGVDVLVRPPTIFSEDRGDKSVHNGLTLGEECIALVIHGTFDSGHLVEDGEYFTRLVVGNAFGIPKMTSMIPPAAGRCEHAMRVPLRSGDAKGAVDAALPHLNDFAQAAAMAFVS